MNRLIQIDCMKYMADIPDNHFELAVVDPPYGIKEDGGRNNRGDRSTKIMNYSLDNVVKP